MEKRRELKNSRHGFEKELFISFIPEPFLLTV